MDLEKLKIELSRMKFYTFLKELPMEGKYHCLLLEKIFFFLMKLNINKEV